MAFAQGNASSYYRKIASEQRKIRTKQVNFYKTSLQFTDENRRNKGRDMVMTQINATKKIIARTPAFQGDSAMRNDYSRILDIYDEAYTDAYDSVQTLSKTMGNSEDDLKKYQDAFYYMQDLIDDAEDKWQMNEDYFTGAYNVSAMADPTKNQLNTLRSLAIYVQDLRSTYASVPFLVTHMQQMVKNKEFDNLEDERQNLGLKAEQGMVAVIRVGNYILEGEEGDEEDDFLKNATIYYLEYVRDAVDDEFEKAMTDLDEARYEESEKQVERAQYKLESLLIDFVETYNDLNSRTEKFVNHYVEE
jgi:hypothetical protein